MHLQFNADNLDICTKVLLKSCSNALCGRKNRFLRSPCCCAQQGKWKVRRARDRASVRWRRAGIFQWVTGESTATQVENYSAAVTEMGHTLLTGSGVPGHPRVCGCKEREKMMHAVLFSLLFPSIFQRPVRHSVPPPPPLTLTLTVTNTSLSPHYSDMSLRTEISF